MHYQCRILESSVHSHMSDKRAKDVRVIPAQTHAHVR